MEDITMSKNLGVKLQDFMEKNELSDESYGFYERLLIEALMRDFRSEPSVDPLALIEVAAKLTSEHPNLRINLRWALSGMCREPESYPPFVINGGRLKIVD